MSESTSDATCAQSECTADATWNGSLDGGHGDVALDSGVWSGSYGTPETPDATDPEELLAAGHAGCFSMTLAFLLSEAGYTPESVSTEATVTVDRGAEGVSISAIELHTVGVVPDAQAEEFATVISQAEAACPISKALTGTTIEVTSELGHDERAESAEG